MKRPALGEAVRGEEGGVEAVVAEEEGEPGEIKARFLKPQPGQKRRNQEMINAMPPTMTDRGKPVRRNAGVFVRTEVDEDEVGDVIQDAVVGPLRRGDKETLSGPGKTERVSDLMVGAREASSAAVMGVMGAAGAAVPPNWTGGSRVGVRTPDTRLVRASGAIMAEGGWNLDPATMGVVAASVNRVATVPGGSVKAQEAMAAAYRRAHEYFRGVADSAKKVGYDFRPRSGEESVAARLPFYESVRFELASRAFDRMWATLRTSREVSGVDSYLEMLVKSGIPLVYHQTIRAAAMRTKVARGAPLRLVMRGSGIDDTGDEGGAQVASSFFFGSNQPRIEHEILAGATQPELRYLFTDRGRYSTKLRMNPALASRLSRVYVHGAFDAERPEAHETTPGLRITIPPAPQGYVRGNVVILLRSNRPPRPPGEGSGAVQQQQQLTTDIILVAHVRDDAVYQRVPSSDGVGEGQVSELPASFVFYHGGAPFPLTGAHPAGYVQPTAVPGEGPPRYTYEWVSIHDLAWLERVSGLDGMFHRTNNENFRRLARMYLEPRDPLGAPRPSSATSTTAATLTDSSRLDVEVYVEQVPTPATVEAIRTERRQWVHERELLQTDDPADRIYAGYFPIPRSFTTMRKFRLRRNETITGGTIEKISALRTAAGDPAGGAPPEQMSQEDAELWALLQSEATDALIESLRGSTGDVRGQQSAPSPTPMGVGEERGLHDDFSPFGEGSTTTTTYFDPLRSIPPSPMPMETTSTTVSPPRLTTTATPLRGPESPLGGRHGGDIGGEGGEDDPDPEGLVNWIDDEARQMREGTERGGGESPFSFDIIGDAYGDDDENNGAREVGGREVGARVAGGQGEDSASEELLGDFDVGTTARAAGETIGDASSDPGARGARPYASDEYGSDGAVEGAYETGGQETEDQHQDEEVLETEDEREQ